MKKILFMIATIYMLGIFVIAIPAFSTSSSFFIKKYAAGKKEKVIIKDVHDSRSKVVQIASGSVLIIYGLFACAVFLDRKKK
jgi:hypothetical protein